MSLILNKPLNTFNLASPQTKESLKNIFYIIRNIFLHTFAFRLLFVTETSVFATVVHLSENMFVLNSGKQEAEKRVTSVT